jgi:hypothetical protein
MVSSDEKPKDVSPVLIKKDNNFLLWLNKFVSVLIVFILIGCAIGFYLSKCIYDIRIEEIIKVGGFVHDQKVYTVTLRP